jgi:hypothetical protein
LQKAWFVGGDSRLGNRRRAGTEGEWKNQLEQDFSPAEEEVQPPMILNVANHATTGSSALIPVNIAV